MRALTGLVLLAAARLVLPVLPAGAADNPHNLSSCSACHPTTPRFGIDTRYTVTFTTSADDPGLCTPVTPPGSIHTRCSSTPVRDPPGRAHRPTFPRAPARLLPGRSSARAATSSMRPTPGTACCAAFPAPPTLATSPPPPPSARNATGTWLESALARSRRRRGILCLLPRRTAASGPEGRGAVKFQGALQNLPPRREG